MTAELVKLAARRMQGANAISMGADPAWETIPEREREHWLYLAEAAIATQQDGAWQPIETAPKDKFLILGWWETWRGEPKWVWEANKAADTYGRWLHGRATHWMPAPCAPEQ